MEAHSNLATTLSRIHAAEKNAARAPNSVQLLAASKGRDISAIQALYAQGQRLFGENYLQEALSKIPLLPDDIIWHFIGPIQSNKTRKIAENFAWVQSVDSVNIARRLNEQRPDHLPALNICIEVNVDQEHSKSGAALEAVPDLIAACVEFPRLTVRGLMTIPAPHTIEVQQRASFHTLHQLYVAFQQHGILLDTLSMGMSNDLEAAIAEGATMVRVGRALFESE